MDLRRSREVNLRLEQFNNDDQGLLIIDHLIQNGIRIEPRTPEALVDWFNRQEMGSVVGEGGYHRVCELRGVPNVVVKRFLSDYQYHAYQELSPAQVFASMRGEHDLLYKYFGDEFIAHSFFFELEHNLPNQKTDGVTQGHEFLVLQERVYGIELCDVSEKIPLAPSLKQKLLNFIQRYRRMLNEQKVVFEAEQLFIDFENETLKMFDTNTLWHFSNGLRQNSFLMKFQIDPNPITEPSALFDFLLTAIPELSYLKKRNYSAACSDLYFRSPLYKTIYQRLEKEYGVKVADDFQVLIRLLDAFPPEGDNRFIRNLVAKFDL